MSFPGENVLRGLNDCQCCEARSAKTPVEVYNRPGLSAVAHRIGTHSSIKETMLTRLTRNDMNALRALRTRENDDFIIALLDAWAMVVDVLTFYQERISNESYLRTAREDRSMHHLAQLIGYKTRPGVAASAWLEFIAETAKGSPPQTTVPAGTRVQSIPGPGEKPQTFETVETIEARPEWNAMRPLMTLSQLPSKDATYIVVKGLDVNLHVGDKVLIVEADKTSAHVVKTVQRLTGNAEIGTTRVDFTEGSKIPESTPKPTGQGEFTYAHIPLNETTVGENVINSIWKQDEVMSFIKVQRWPVTDVRKYLSMKRMKNEIPEGDPSIYMLSQNAGVFGYNASRYEMLKDNCLIDLDEKDWDNPPRKLQDEAESKCYVFLDGIYRGIVKGSWVVLEDTSTNVSYMCQIEGVAEVTKTGFGMSARVTRLQLNPGSDSNDALSGLEVRKTMVHLAESEPLELARLPLADEVPDKNEKNSVMLDEPELLITAGRVVILSGEQTDLEGTKESEVLTVSHVSIIGGYTKLTFTTDIQHSYKRESVRINANVALATHGEHKGEVLGGGDGSAAFQRFVLRQPPLTYVSSEEPDGARSTLEVWVDGLKWSEVPSLYGCGPSERVYTTSTDTNGNTTIQFGDGRIGSRLPTGQENVRAEYRSGMGEEGLVGAGQLSLLITRPLGIRETRNPRPASGAQDRDRLAQIRRNAPLPIMTLDRIVSLRDYEDFALAFAGIVKALATWTWDGRKRGVFVTVAGAQGASIDPDSNIYKNLLSAMHKAADPRVPLSVETFKPAFFSAEGKVKIQADYRKKEVLEAVEVALRERFSFDVRAFGQHVHRSEVVTAIQSVPGVVAVDVDRLYRINPITEGDTLVASLPEAGEQAPLAAELLTLSAGPIAMGEMP